MPGRQNSGASIVPAAAPPRQESRAKPYQPPMPDTATMANQTPVQSQAGMASFLPMERMSDHGSSSVCAAITPDTAPLAPTRGMEDQALARPWTRPPAIPHRR